MYHLLVLYVNLHNPMRLWDLINNFKYSLDNHSMRKVLAYYYD